MPEETSRTPTSSSRGPAVKEASGRSSRLSIAPRRSPSAGASLPESLDALSPFSVHNEAAVTQGIQIPRFARDDREGKAGSSGMTGQRRKGMAQRSWAGLTVLAAALVLPH